LLERNGSSKSCPEDLYQWATSGEGEIENGSCPVDGSDEDLENRCEKDLNRDLLTCSALGKRFGKETYFVCERQAFARYGRCLQGSDIRPPLPHWGL
jgi:hypothetical protein